MIALENAERCPLTEAALDALRDKLIPHEGRMGMSVFSSNRDIYLLRAVRLGLITYDEAKWMYWVALGLAVNANVWDSIHAHEA